MTHDQSTQVIYLLASLAAMQLFGILVTFGKLKTGAALVMTGLAMAVGVLVVTR